jgi:hypothetical protein
MYRVAHKGCGEVVFYFDAAGNKYAATGGSLAWRLNNPGLVRRCDLLVRRDGVIGSYGSFAIFSHPKKGHDALASCLCSKTIYQSSIKTIAKQYQPSDPNAFACQLSLLANVPQDMQSNLLTIRSLSG